MKALTRLAVENRALLDHLETHGAPKSVDEFARILERDPSNFRKTLKALAAEGWLLLGKAGGGTPVQLTDDGHQAAKGLQVAEGRLRAGLPPLIHAQITPDPNQPRKQFDAEDLGELSENIADRGLLQPILVRLTGPDRADLVAGERRWRAIGLLIDKGDPRWPADRPIPYHVSAQSDEAEILADQVIENLQRKGLHPLEEALAFQQLKEAHGWGVGQIAGAVTRTRRFVEQRLDLMNLTPDLQARMRLPKDDPQHLTIPRAREILQHLRQINDKTAEQRDLEEIAPGGALASASPEDLEAARKPKLEPRDLLALGEIAAAAELNPSPDFPDSPVPVVEIDWSKAMAGPIGIRLQTTHLAELLINGDATPKVAGARVAPLGHIRLRQENLHPADNPRALFHLRREAGISADQARQLGNLGRWATPFLTITPAATAPAPARPVPAEAEGCAPGSDQQQPQLGLIDPLAQTLAALTDVEIRIVREVAHAQSCVGGNPPRVGRYWLDLDAVNLWKRTPAGLLEFKAHPGEAWTVELTEQGQAVVKALEPDYDPVALQMRVEREGKFQSDWLNPPPLQSPESQAATEPDQLIEIDHDQVETSDLLRQVREGLAAGAPDFAGLLQLAGLRAPFEAHVPWSAVRDQAQTAVAIIDPWGEGEEAVVQARAELIGFALNLAAGYVAPPAAEAHAPDDLQAELHRTGGDLLDALARIIPPATPMFTEIGAVYEPFAKARNAVAWANRRKAAEPAEAGEAQAPPLLEIRAGDIVTKGGAMTWRLLEGVERSGAKPGLRPHAFKAQPILHGKDYGKPTTISLADITALVEEAR